MKLFYFVGIIALALLSVVVAHSPKKASGDSDITKFLKHLEVIPDVITEGPSDFLKVCYDSGVCADKGVELTPTQVKNQPKVEWKAQKNAFYTLIMTDPDAPSRAKPDLREFNHWLVGNIPGKDITAGEVLTEYVGSGPPKDTGLHRYVFLLYKQPKKLQFKEKHISKTTVEGRPSFSAKKFAAGYKLGAPLAANFYQAQYDDYVPTVHEQLGFHE